MLNMKRKLVRLAIFVTGLIVLSKTAKKFRELIGESSSKSGQFTAINCLDMKYGTLACGVKEGIKLYIYNLENMHVEKIRHRATEIALAENIKEGVATDKALKQAKKVGDKEAKLAFQQANKIIGPMTSSGWDFFEVTYYGGSFSEGFLRGGGTLCGTYVGGFSGERKLGRVGYLCGSQLGSWIGGRVGLMIYDVVNGIHYLINFKSVV